MEADFLTNYAKQYIQLSKLQAERKRLGEKIIQKNQLRESEFLIMPDSQYLTIYTNWVEIGDRITALEKELSYMTHEVHNFFEIHPALFKVYISDGTRTSFTHLIEKDKNEYHVTELV